MFLNFLKEPDVYIISYPKTGRTWLRLLLGHLICRKYGLDETAALEIKKITRKAGIKLTGFTHDDSNMVKKLHYRDMIVDKRKYKNRTIILLIRDVRDTMVSCYFQAKNRIKVFDGTISEFIRDERYGVNKYLCFYKVWEQQMNVPSQFKIITYEDMHNNTETIVRSVCDLIGINDLTDAEIQETVQYSSFENMKKLESSNHFNSSILKADNSGNKDSYKVRKGKIGGYQEYLTNEDIEYIKEEVKESGNPFSLCLNESVK